MNTLEEYTQSVNAEYYDAEAKALPARRPYDNMDLILGLHERAMKAASADGAIETLKVVDLGAGVTGVNSIPYLEKGHTVTAVDISEGALASMREAVTGCSGTLQTCCQDLSSFLTDLIEKGEQVDVIVVRATLHHIPDYEEVVRLSAQALRPGGVFYCHDDPCFYSEMPKFHKAFSDLCYFTNRLFTGNYIRGIKTRLRRLRGVIDENRPEDMIEFHVIREGVNEGAIAKVLEAEGCEAEIVYYFQTGNLAARPIGKRLGIRNNFACIAQKKGA